jgi:hypothetical protein
MTTIPQQQRQTTKATTAPIMTNRLSLPPIDLSVVDPPELKVYPPNSELKKF